MSHHFFKVHKDFGSECRPTDNATRSVRNIVRREVYVFFALE